MTSQYYKEGFGNVTPYLMAADVARLIDFIRHVFDGQMTAKLHRTDGSIMHAEMRIGNSMIMMGEPREGDQWGTAHLYIYVPDCDAVFARAIAAGATAIQEVTTMVHAGQRYGGVTDSSGNTWWIATHLENLSADQEQERINQLGL